MLTDPASILFSTQPYMEMPIPTTTHNSTSSCQKVLVIILNRQDHLIKIRKAPKAVTSLLKLNEFSHTHSRPLLETLPPSKPSTATSQFPYLQNPVKAKSSDARASEFRDTKSAPTRGGGGQYRNKLLVNKRRPLKAEWYI